MRVRFWGTRGSIPTPGPSTVRYGGNTSCIEIRTAAGTLLVLDCGTGARALGQALLAESENGGQPTTGTVLIGHTHWDHIQGLPFFAPLFRPGDQWTLYGPRGLSQSLSETLAGQMQYTYFPVALEQLGADVTYLDLVEGSFEIGDATVRTQYLNHPALTLGYRIEADGWTVVYAADHEPFDPELAPGGDLTASPADRRHVRFLEGADVVIHDAQYLAAEYDQRIGWGHSTMEYAVDAAMLAGVGRLVLIHHDPDRTDAAMDGLLVSARARGAAGGFAGEIDAALEGVAIDLPARRPPVPVEGALTTATWVPAVEDLSAGVELAVRDPEAAAQLRAAAEAEGLELLDGPTPPGERTIVVVDVDEAPAGASPTGPNGNLVTTIGLTRRLPTAALAAVDDWIVWPCSLAHLRTKLRAAILRRACRWQAPPRPADEERRLASLYALELLDTPPEQRFDRLTALARRELSVPVALITLVDRDRQWFKSASGFELAETDRDVSLCAHAILGDGVFEVPDLQADARFADLPAEPGAPRVRSYAGVPLTLADGSRAGTLCVADYRPRQFDAGQLAELRRIASLVEAELVAHSPAGGPAPPQR